MTELTNIEMPLDEILMINHPHSEFPWNWVNPDIEQILSDCPEHDINEGFLHGNFVRIWWPMGGKKPSYHFVVKLNDEAYAKYLEEGDSEEKQMVVDHTIGMIQLYLTEDCWITGGEQFCFTDFGKLIGPEITEIYKDPESQIVMSPDVGVEVGDTVDEWTWSS